MPPSLRRRGRAGDTGSVSIRVVIVDDNGPWLEAASALLEREGMSVAGVASTKAAALRDVRELRPDVVLVDIFLGEESGFDVAQEISEDDQCSAHVILISSHSEDDVIDLIAESPVRGFLPKAKLSAQAIRGKLAA
jgi:DNA-binding NarL/FixJ family response regulator